MSSILYKKIQKTFALFICAVFIIGALPFVEVGAVNTDKNESGYISVAQNSKLNLMADKATGAFAVENKQTRKVWYSTPIDADEDEITIGSARTDMQSQVVIHYLYKEDELVSKSVKSANSYAECVMQKHITVEAISDGICVKYDFADIGINIPVKYTLGDGYLTAEVDFENIKISDEVYLMAIQLLPSFGANNIAKEGYLFVPDGCGAIINFVNGIDSEGYESMVYGNELAIPVEKETTQTETVRMPVFGINDGDDGLFAIVTKGDKNLSIVAQNKNSTCGYDMISSRRILRQLTQKTIYEKDPANRQDIGRVTQPDTEGYAVRYYFLSGEDAGYVGMASVYRKYLQTECSLKKNPLKPTFALDLYGAIDCKASFLGIPYTAKKKLTTYSQAQTIIKALKEADVENISVRYLGWTGDGLLNINRLKKASPISLLGGKKKYSGLLEYTKKNNIELYSDIDFIQYRKGSASIAVKTAFEQVSKQYHFLRSVYSEDTKTNYTKLLSPTHLYKTSKQVLKSYYKLSQDSISISGLGDCLYSNFSEKNFISRSSSGEKIMSTLSEIDKKGKTIALDGGNIYTVPFSDRLYDVPTSSSKYDIFNYDVPFYQIVLHGYVTMSGEQFEQSAEPIDSFLKAVETGSELHYGGMFAKSSTVTGTRYDNLYGTTYTLWIDKAAEQYAKYMPILESVYDKNIVNHKYLSQKVVCTTFENGFEVVINYSDEVFIHNGVKIAPKDFAKFEKEGGI